MKLFYALVIMAVAAFSVVAQDWSEYSRGSSEWHRHNRDAMFRPWKYDRGGRLKKGSSYSKSGKRHAHSSRRPRRHR